MDLQRIRRFLNAGHGWVGVGVLIVGLLAIVALVPFQGWRFAVIRLGLLVALSVPFILAKWAADRDEPPNSN